MMNHRAAFIVAAGKGTRMMPLTQDQPKPMVKIHDRPILDYIYDHLVRVGVNHIILNTHYKADCIERWADEKRNENSSIKITTLFEEELLETGGGLLNVIQQAELENEDSLLMINGDAFWTDGDVVTLDHLLQHWEHIKKDADMSLVMQATQDLVFGERSGDYKILEGGMPQRSLSKSGDYMFTGIRIVNPKALIQYPNEGKIFSFLKMMDYAEETGRLNAYTHRGLWYHLSTPEDIKEMERTLHQNECKTPKVK